MMDLRSLTEKKGPLPVWAWALITAVVLYLLYRHFKGSSSGSSSSNAATDSGTSDGSVAATPTDTGYASGPVDTSGNAVTPLDTLANTNPSADNTLLPWWADPTNFPSPAVPPLGSANPTNTTLGNSGGDTPAQYEPKPVARTTTPALKSIIPGITGQVKTQKVLPSGAKLVTLTSGREIEQAPGKKPYVVKK